MKILNWKPRLSTMNEMMSGAWNTKLDTEAEQMIEQQKLKLMFSLKNIFECR